MGRPRKPTPLKHCAWCGIVMERKVYGERIEDSAVFLKRKYCDQTCMARAFERDTINSRRRKASIHKKSACERCGETGAHLQVHHMDSDTANNSPSNLMTLCASCHATWHWEHGKKWPKPPSVCSVCGRFADGLGLCAKHRLRFKKYGDPCLTKRRHGSQYVLVREVCFTPSGLELAA